MSTLLAASMLFLPHSPDSRAAVELRDHAHEIGFGSGWECDRGDFGRDEDFYGLYRSLNAYENTFNGEDDLLVLEPDS